MNGWSRTDSMSAADMLHNLADERARYIPSPEWSEDLMQITITRTERDRLLDIAAKLKSFSI
jgi:hypothetical protein